MTQRTLLHELQVHLEALSQRFGQLNDPLHAFLADSVAVNYYTGQPLSDVVDIHFSHRVPIPSELQIFEVPDPSDPAEVRVVTMNGGMSDVLGSFPPDWEGRAQEVGMVGNIVVHVIDPVDLAVSKVARFQDRDQADIRQLAARGLVDPDTFHVSAEEALELYVGDTTWIRRNLRSALTLIRSAML